MAEEPVDAIEAVQEILMIDDDDTATTLSVHETREEREPSFLPHDFQYVPNRDLMMNASDLFTYLIQANIRNPMTLSRDVDLPSIKDILLDFISSKHSWCDAIQKQKIISNRNHNYLSILSSLNSRRISSHIRSGTLTDTISQETSDIMRRICRTSITQSNYLRFLSKFVEQNCELLTIHESDADEPFDIFQIKLPVWFAGPEGQHLIKWTSLYDVLTKILFNDRVKASPTLPSPESFSCTRYLGRLFSNSTIANNTPVQDSPNNPSLSNIMTRIRARMNIGTMSANNQRAIFLRNNAGTQYSIIGKTRYTLSVILRWIELTHTMLFRDQISHSIMYHFYRNIHTIPTTILSGGTRKRYVNASIRTLTRESMPDEEDDPVLLVPFEEGQDVYKMKCCRKDLSMDAVLGIIQSGRTPVCPMCRARLFTTDPECPLDPTYTPPEVIRVVENCPSYVLNPNIPPSSYVRNPITLE